MARFTLALRNVSVVRSGRPILNDVTWSLRPGESWGVIGPNGSGKTTLLNMISGNTWPTAGDIQVLGRAFGEYDLRELRKRIGWVSAAIQEKVHAEDTALSVTVSGKYASFGLYEKPARRDWKRAENLLDFVGLEGFADHPFATLSQGEKQKALICRALMTNPALLVLDEPCAGLDIRAREQLLAVLQRLATRRTRPPALIFATHHVEEIAPVISHILTLENGSIVRAETKEKALTSRKLSALFGLPIRIARRNGRYFSTVPVGDAPAR